MPEQWKYKLLTVILKHSLPHGLVLGALLFWIFINELPEDIKAEIKLFANDVKLLVRLLSKWTIHSSKYIVILRRYLGISTIVDYLMPNPFLYI